MNEDVAEKIATLIEKDNVPYKLLKWIDPQKLNINSLCENPNAIDFLKKQPKRNLNIYSLAKNKNAIPLLKSMFSPISMIVIIYRNKNAINEFYEKDINSSSKWDNICLNTNAIHIIKKKIKHANLRSLCRNKEAIKLIQDYFSYDEIPIYDLASNINGIELLRKVIKHIKNVSIEECNDYKLWSRLSRNSSKDAIDILKNNRDKINWTFLSANPNARELLIDNLDKVNWNLLSMNKNMLDILEKNKELICWDYFSKNSGIFEIDNGALENKINNTKTLVKCLEFKKCTY